MATSKNNMSIWDEVSTTDPKHTKKVNQRGGFTAIDAHYQIEQATKQFGPVGIGWGYDVGAPIFTPNDLIIVPVTLWHGSRDNVFGPQLGCAAIQSGSRADSDAPKKATTDAITKLLSHLGFNADVFLGKFDDNKYVAEVSKQMANASPFKEQTDEIIKQIKKVDDSTKLFAVFEANQDILSKIKLKDPAAAQSIVAAYKLRKSEL